MEGNGACAVIAEVPVQTRLEPELCWRLLADVPLHEVSNPTALPNAVCLDFILSASLPTS
jgi:hypothetical protein